MIPIPRSCTTFEGMTLPRGTFYASSLQKTLEAVWYMMYHKVSFRVLTSPRSRVGSHGLESRSRGGQLALAVRVVTDLPRVTRPSVRARARTREAKPAKIHSTHAEPGTTIAYEKRTCARGRLYQAGRSALAHGREFQFVFRAGARERVITGSVAYRGIRVPPSARHALRQVLGTPQLTSLTAVFST